MTDEEDFSIRIAEIKSRIAYLRSVIGGTEESNQDSSIVAERPKDREVRKDDDQRSEKERELADIKAKLLGKRG
jgi:hypothetical protein